MHDVAAVGWRLMCTIQDDSLTPIVVCLYTELQLKWECDTSQYATGDQECLSDEQLLSVEGGII